MAAKAPVSSGGCSPRCRRAVVDNANQEACRERHSERVVHPLMGRWSTTTCTYLSMTRTSSMGWSTMSWEDLSGSILAGCGLYAALDAARPEGLAYPCGADYPRGGHQPVTFPA